LKIDTIVVTYANIERVAAEHKLDVDILRKKLKDAYERNQLYTLTVYDFGPDPE